MSKVFAKIMHHIIRFIYPYIKDIEHEYNDAKTRELRTKFKKIGRYSTIGTNPIIHGPENISIGEHVFAREGFRLEAIKSAGNQTFNPELIIGDNITTGDYIHIGCVEKVQIGNGCLIADKVFITDHFHGSITKEAVKTPLGDRPLTSKPVIIGNNVWLGNSVSIMPGVTLGDNVIVGANSVVTHSFPANSVIAGCPARLIKMLD